MLDLFIDAILDTLKLLPFLFITFIILELLEHKFSKKSEKILSKNSKIGPLFGGLLGIVPQCGFSAMGANLYSSKIITRGTLIAIFLSTSDEMLPLLISGNVDISKILLILGIKLCVAILISFVIDLLFKNKISSKEINHMCEEHHCDCDEKGPVISSIHHSLEIGLFVLIANIVMNLLIYFIGEQTISNLLLSHNILTYFISSLIGLIPNCASSIILTETYINGFISLGMLISGLLTGSGIGLLILFKTNKSLKDNLFIVSILYVIGVIIGLIVDLLI